MAAVQLPLGFTIFPRLFAKKGLCFFVIIKEVFVACIFLFYLFL